MRMGEMHTNSDAIPQSVTDQEETTAFIAGIHCHHAQKETLAPCSAVEPERGYRSLVSVSRLAFRLRGIRRRTRNQR